jgi:hypothetical protein
MHSVLSSIFTLLLIPATFGFPGDGILNDVYRHGWVELLSPKADLVAGAACDYDPTSVDWQSMFVFYREVRNVHEISLHLHMEVLTQCACSCGSPYPMCMTLMYDLMTFPNLLDIC